MMEKILEVPCPPFDLQLSHWDRRFMPSYSKRVLCFSLAKNDMKFKETITEMLFAALQSTVEELPFLAGSIERFSKDKPWVHGICSQGAAYLEVKDYSQDISFSSLRKACFPSALLDSQKLCPLPKLAYNQDGDYPADVCRFRASFVNGGLLLVISIAHTICDGRGISDIIGIFADRFRQAQTGELTRRSTNGEEMTKPIYKLDRTSVLVGNGLPGAIENHPWMTIAPLTGSLSALFNTKTICTNFHISKESLIALKQAASPSSSPSLRSDSQQPHSPDPAPFISTHDAIVALIWRSIMLARHRASIISPSTPTNCCYPVDCRARLHLSQPYFGNAIYGAQCSLTLRDLAPASDDPNAARISGLQNTACLIRQGINGVTADRVRDLLDFVARTNMEKYTRLAIFKDITVGSILLTSYFGFKLHELDFGPALGGKMEAFRLPSQGLMPGMPVVLPRLLDGGCEFVVNEREDVMGFLAEDDVWRRFVGTEYAAETKLDGAV